VDTSRCLRFVRLVLYILWPIFMKFCMDVTPLKNIPVLYVQSASYSNIIMADARNLLGWEQSPPPPPFFHGGTRKVNFSRLWRSVINMIYLLSAVGLTPCGSSTIHIYTKTVHRTIQWNRTYVTVRIHKHNNKETWFTKLNRSIQKIQPYIQW